MDKTVQIGIGLLGLCAAVYLGIDLYSRSQMEIGLCMENLKVI